MKKTIIAATIAVSLLSGCSMFGSQKATSYKDLKAEGQELIVASKGGHYSASHIQNLEKARLAVNSVFLIAEPLYERYTEKLINTPDLGNYMAATEDAKTEEEKKAIYDGLSDEMKAKVDKFVNSSAMSGVMDSAKDVAQVIWADSNVFLKASSGSILSQIDFSDLMGEKNRISHTTDQVSYLNRTLISAYKNYKIISAFSAAE